MVRQMTNEQRAAHLMMGIVSDVVKGFRADALRTEQDARKAAKHADAQLDWAEFKSKAQGRLEGSQAVLRRLQEVARGDGYAAADGGPPRAAS